MDDQLRGTTAVGNSSMLMGVVGLSSGTGSLHLPFPLAHSTLLSATELHWHWLCLVKPSVWPEPQLLCGQSTLWSAADKQREVWELTPACKRASRRVGSSHISGHLRMDGLIPTSLVVTQPGTDCMDVPWAHLLLPQVPHLLSSAALDTSICSTKGNEVKSYDELDKKIVTPAVCYCLTIQCFSCLVPLFHYVVWTRKQTSLLMAECGRMG